MLIGFGSNKNFVIFQRSERIECQEEETLVPCTTCTRSSTKNINVTTGITQIHLERQQVTMEVVGLAQTAQRAQIIRHIIFVHPLRQYRATIQATVDQEATIPIPKIVCPLNLKVAQATRVL